MHPDHVLIPSGCRKSASAPFWRENALPSVFLKATAIRTASQFYAVFLSRASCHLTCFQEWLFKIYFIGYAVNSCPIFPPSLPSTLHTHPPTFPLFSSCPLVIHVSSLTSTFPILYLTFPSISYLPFILLSLYLFPLITLHVISISVILFLF